MNKYVFYDEKRCRYCGRNFIAAPEHVFKLGSAQHPKWFCKYTCMARYREEQDAKRKYKRRDTVR